MGGEGSALDVKSEAARERGLAWRVLVYLAGSDQGPANLADATERAFGRLYYRLVDLIGPAGFDALARRALYLAKAESPYLGSVECEIHGEGYRLPGLRASVEGREPSEVRIGLVAMLGDFFWLLDSFVGDSLFLRLMRGTWPEMNPAEITLTSEEHRR